MKKMNASEKTTRKTQNSQPSHTLLTHTIKTTHLIVRARSFLERLRAREKKRERKSERRSWEKSNGSPRLRTRAELAINWNPPLVPQRIISEREGESEKVKKERIYRNIAKLIREISAALGGRRSIAEMKSVNSNTERRSLMKRCCNKHTNQVKHDLYRRISSFRFWSFGGRKRLARERWKSVEVGLRRA